MKKRILSQAAFVLLSVAFTSCSNENESTAVSNGEMNIITNIEGSVSTRSEKFEWEENDRLGVFVCNGTIDQPYLGNSDRYTNVLFKHNGKGFFAQHVYLDENRAEVFAYYPYDVKSTTGGAIPVESTTQTDYLYGHSDEPASITKKNVTIRMKHALSQVVFKLRKAAAYNEGDCLLQALTIENNDANNVFKTAGTLDLSTGNMTGTSTDGVLALMPGNTLSLTEEYQNVSSICLPVSTTAGKNIKAVFTIDSRQFHYEFPAGTTWNPGYRNIYTLTVTNSSVDIGGDGSGDGTSDGGITIEPWAENTDTDISLVPIL
jgi:hypothetical protein